MNATAASGAAELLALWECAAAAAPPDRDDALLAALGDTPPPPSLGARNAALLALRARLFGRAQPLRCDCPHCGAVSEFAVDCEALSQTLLPDDAARRPQRLEADGYRIDFRVPDAADVRRAARSADDDGFVQALLRRCVLHCDLEGADCDADALPAAVADALSHRMEELDPGASVSFDLACPDCGDTWNAAMDVGGVLWSELQTRAERLLLDVDALARAYGWSEPQVLGLSPLRRAAYLQLVGAG